MLLDDRIYDTPVESTVAATQRREGDRLNVALDDKLMKRFESCDYVLNL